MELSTSKTRGRMGTSFGHSDFWDHFGGQALVMIGGWYSRQPLTSLLANLNNPRNRYPRGRLYAFSLGIVSGMRNFGSSVAGTQSDSKSPHLGSSQVNSSSVCG